MGFVCCLPGGYVDDAGGVHTDADLSPLSGWDEEMLVQSDGPSPAEVVTALLTRCVKRIGAVSPVTPEIARSLTVADRQYLLLKVRELTFGDKVRGSTFCAWTDCGARVDIDFSLAQMPVEPSFDKGPLYEMLLPEGAGVLSAGQEQRRISLRLPNGGDQEALSAMVARNEARTLTLLLTRCIRRIGSEDASGELVAQLSPAARRMIEEFMERVAPRVELDMEAQCPECGRAFPVPFDLQEVFFGEFRNRGDQLYRQVYHLASHYHWSERDIMSMSRGRRQKYLDILADELEKANYG